MVKKFKQGQYDDFFLGNRSSYAKAIISRLISRQQRYHGNNKTNPKYN